MPITVQEKPLLWDKMYRLKTVRMIILIMCRPRLMSVFVP
jgi:hypothetical protein